MVEATLQQAAERRAPAMCPMASMCSRMMEKRPSGILLMLPGALLILLGVLIFLEPKVVVWLAGTFAVLFGILLLMMARFMSRLRH